MPSSTPLRGPDGRTGRADGGREPQLTPGPQLAAGVRELMRVSLDRIAGLVVDKAEQAAGTLERVAAEGGPTIAALLGGARAKLGGRNPAWGALKGAFGALSPGTRAAILVLLVLGIVLLPVTLLLTLLALVVVAIVLIARSRG